MTSTDINAEAQNGLQDIVQGQAGGKGLPATVTVQQLQQIVKSVAGSGQGQPTQQVWLSSSLIWWRALHLQNLPLRSSRTQFLPSLVLPVKLFRRESFLCLVLLQGRDNRQYRYCLHFSSYLHFRHYLFIIIFIQQIMT